MLIKKNKMKKLKIPHCEYLKIIESKIKKYHTVRTCPKTYRKSKKKQNSCPLHKKEVKQLMGTLFLMEAKLDKNLHRIK